MNNEYMGIAIDHLVKISADEVPVVALLLNIKTGEYSVHYNMVYSSYDPTAHAEICAIRSECQKIKSNMLNDYDMFVTLEPCAMCAQAISEARIRRLYFSAYDEKSGGVESGARIYYQKSCHYKPEFYGGIMEQQSSSLIKQYFANLRKKC